MARRYAEPMLRSSSFRRRRSQRQAGERRAPFDEDSGEDSGAENAAATPRRGAGGSGGGGGILGSIKRSASFGRRKNRESKGAGPSKHSQEDDDEDTSRAEEIAARASPSEQVTARTVRLPVGFASGDHASAGTASYDVPAVGSINGWLHKRHTHEKKLGSQWAKRYFAVDEHRGTLAYSKSEFKRPTVVLPLCDITSVKQLELEMHGPFCFMISCPPVHLTVKAADIEV